MCLLQAAGTMCPPAKTAIASNFGIRRRPTSTHAFRLKSEIVDWRYVQLPRFCINKTFRYR